MLSTSVQIHHQLFAKKCLIFLKMEMQVTPEIKSKPFKTWLLIGLLPVWFTAVSYGAYRLHKEMTTMPPPLVFLIPADYSGPVFFFFNQPDGVDVQPDPLGQAVNVPENGVVKIKARANDVVPKGDEKFRPVYMIFVDKNGKRTIPRFNINPWYDENSKWFDGYLDEKSQLNSFPILDGKDGFYYFNDQQRSEKMVFNHDTCDHQNFTNVSMLAPDNSWARNHPGPACGKFLITTPNEIFKLPDWMWEDSQRSYNSIQSFVDEANERVQKKKEYYKLP
jgi:hypothetical protein